jgi:hypothetical protein
MSAEQIKRLADEYALSYCNSSNQQAPGEVKAALHAAIDAALPGVRPVLERMKAALRELWATQYPSDWQDEFVKEIDALLAHTADPPINAADRAAEPNKPAPVVRGKTPASAAPNVPSAELREYAEHLRNGGWNLRAPQEMADMIAAALDQIAERASPQAVPKQVGQIVQHQHGKEAEIWNIGNLAGGSYLYVVDKTANLPVDKSENSPTQAVDAPVTPALTDAQISDLWSWSMTAEAEKTATTQQHAFAYALIRALKAPAKESDG